jgi:hypothetical protein
MEGGGKMGDTIKLSATGFLAMMWISGAAFAQTDRGSLWIGGKGMYNSQGGALYGASDVRTNTVRLEPVVHYFIAPGLFVGPAVTYERTWAGNNVQTSLGAGGRIGLTLSVPGDNLIPYLAAGLEYLYYQHTSESFYYFQTDEAVTSGAEIFLGGGIVVVALKHAGIEIEAGYRIQAVKPKGEVKSYSGNVLSVGFGFIGLFY